MATLTLPHAPTFLQQRPAGKPPLSSRAGRMTMTGGESQIDWAGLVPHFVHPIQVQIIEVMTWIGEPLSASELAHVFLGEYDLSQVSYHLTRLAAVGIFKPVGRRQVRGAVQTFYYFSEAT